MKKHSHGGVMSCCGLTVCCWHGWDLPAPRAAAGVDAPACFVFSSLMAWLPSRSWGCEQDRGARWGELCSVWFSPP